MKHVDEYRDAELVNTIANKIKALNVPACNIMEICGGQTHAIMKYNLTSMLPKQINLIHGPGCPVCVTPANKIDKAIELSRSPDNIVVSFGDMLRVPGSSIDLLTAKADGADIRMVYSPLDSIKIAMKNPSKQVIFFAIGFETTAPINALSVIEAEKRNLENFSILCSQVLVPPAINFILSSPDNNIDGFLAAGHVCTVTGYNDYLPIAKNFKIPISVTGFEPADILYGIYAVAKQIRNNTYELTNEYKRSVNKLGNISAQNSINQVFDISDQEWRGIGIIPNSGLIVNEKYKKYDTEHRFHLLNNHHSTKNLCIAGEILQGRLKPNECPVFGKQCTPENPLGAPMVSDEGACSAYYRFKN